MARVRKLGVEDSVVFLDQFVDQPTLLNFISMCDVYVTPYLSAAQMTSGTLAYSFGLGKAVVSTPYWHARELLADGHGVLVPSGDSATIGIEIADLLTDDRRRNAMRERAYVSSRSMTWERTAERYMAVFEGARWAHRRRTFIRNKRRGARYMSHTPPEMRVDYFLSMCDDTGLFQHAVYTMPDRLHGYCIDDNARALILACTLNRSNKGLLPEALAPRFASFIQHAWNPDTKRFRNFMSFDRRWLEEQGSEDSHARTLWALGECARNDIAPMRRRWASELFAEALPTVEAFDLVRPWAFTLLGLDAYCASVTNDPEAERLRSVFADRLMARLSETTTEDWVWFEDGLTYDNARLPQALIATGISTGVSAYVEAGLKSLRWLMTQQTAPGGFFRPVGSETFGDKRVPPRPYDQQPVEATATISACLTAWQADGNAEWRAAAIRTFEWFLGRNDLSMPMADLETGSCCDGLKPNRRNENCGAESVLAYLFSLAEIRQLSQVGSEFGPLRAMRA
jgi:hypothetical protein